MLPGTKSRPKSTLHPGTPGSRSGVSIIFGRLSRPARWYTCRVAARTIPASVLSTTLVVRRRFRPFVSVQPHASAPLPCTGNPAERTWVRASPASTWATSASGTFWRLAGEVLGDGDADGVALTDGVAEVV